MIPLAKARYFRKMSQQAKNRDSCRIDVMVHSCGGIGAFGEAGLWVIHPNLPSPKPEILNRKP